MVIPFKNLVEKLKISFKFKRGHVVKNTNNTNGIIIQQGDHSKTFVNTKNMELQEKLERILNSADPKYFEMLKQANQVSVLLTDGELDNIKEIEYLLLKNNIVRIESNGNMIQNRPDGKMRTGWIIYRLSNFN